VAADGGAMGGGGGKRRGDGADGVAGSGDWGLGKWRDNNGDFLGFSAVCVPYWAVDGMKSYGLAQYHVSDKASAYQNTNLIP